MPLPRLIHPVQVTIERFDRDNMLLDNDARETVHGARSQSGDVIVLPCQVHFDKFGDPQAEVGGVVTTTSGYILARAFDMDNVIGLGLRLKRGDHITQYTSRSGGEPIVCVMFITRGDPFGHYPDRGATLYKYHFEDRDPVQ